MDQIRLIIEPIKKKWVYHFIVSPKTNNIEKPEWYLNQTLKWIHEHMDVVELKAKSRLNKKSQDVRQMFILCMLELVIMRLSMDLENLPADDLEENPHSKAILVHIYNEVIQFSKVLCQLLGVEYYKLDKVHQLFDLFQEHHLATLRAVERESADKNFREITESSNAWDPVLDENFIDTFKIPKCVDSLLLLIRAISERAGCFLRLENQLGLVKLQHQLLSRLLEFLKKSDPTPSPTSKNFLKDFLLLKDDCSTINVSRIARVLNGVNFVRLILKDRNFIPKRLNIESGTDLSGEIGKLAEDYKKFFSKLVDWLVNISKDFEDNLNGFLNFIKPKLAENVYEIVQDDIIGKHEMRKTKGIR